MTLEKLPIKPICNCLRTSSLSRMGWQFFEYMDLGSSKRASGRPSCPPFTLLPGSESQVRWRFEAVDAASKCECFDAAACLRVLSPDIIVLTIASFTNLFPFVLPSVNEVRCLPSTSTDIQSVAVLLYDHLMTFCQKTFDLTDVDAGNEVDYLWRRSKARSAYWSFFNRYCIFFGNTSIGDDLGFTTLSAQVCSSIHPLVLRGLIKILFLGVTTVSTVDAHLSDLSGVRQAFFWQQWRMLNYSFRSSHIANICIVQLLD
ncbi:hypothetical protein Hypma_003763 [Hypsizygus marmoreus]|uniref:Uncharacterized protein n=1 Tax=Hypsizygus marmoreus TaxID=39966 RepID=A0A369J550_HYPMA|nr:hypothetical protein Hypma_003763 [Hypsizygus marmoreus]